jgi:hypothetical protein
MSTVCTDDPEAEIRAEARRLLEQVATDADDLPKSEPLQDPPQSLAGGRLSFDLRIYLNSRRKAPLFSASPDKGRLGGVVVVQTKYERL